MLHDIRRYDRVERSALKLRTGVQLLGVMTDEFVSREHPAERLKTFPVVIETDQGGSGLSKLAMEEAPLGQTGSSERVISAAHVQHRLVGNVFNQPLVSIDYQHTWDCFHCLHAALL
jgi:hypothetical protein